jgi:hypothetical protein
VTPDPPERQHRDGGWLFWASTAVGWCIIGAAVVGAWSDRRDARPGQLARWVLGGAIAHDLLWLPLVALVGTVLTRLARGRLPWPVTWALATSAVMLAVAWPFVRGYGRQAGNPSLLPRNYGAGVLVYLAAIWLVALGLVAARTTRRRAAARRATGATLEGEVSA